MKRQYSPSGPELTFSMIAATSASGGRPDVADASDHFRFLPEADVIPTQYTPADWTRREG